MSYKLKLNDRVLVWPDINFNKNHWIIYIQLYKNDKIIPIKNEYFNEQWSDRFDNKFITSYNTISWRDGGDFVSGKKDTIIRAGKQGRNVLQQAILEVQSKYKKQLDKHDESRIPPMLLKVYDDYPAEYFDNFKEDLYCQRKYNGTRTMARFIDGKIVLYSRKLHIYNVPNIEDCLVLYLSNLSNQDIIVDGELYIHKTPLQITSGIVRGSDLKEKGRLIYVMFDLLNLKDMKMRFHERYNLLTHIFKGAGLPLIIAPTYLIKIGEMDKFYKKFLTEGYEGLILRRDGPYEPSYHGKKSDMTFKHKPVRTDEYKIIGYTQGKGKDANLVVWICETKAHKEFTVRPKMSNKDRRALYNYLKRGGFSKYKGQYLTIEYDNISIDGLPQQPRALLIRDYE
jgi:ATP-dependent DNA ligase